MATRYSGEAVIRVAYTDAGDYRCTVSCGGHSETFTVVAPAAGFGAGVAYDAPRAYDATARAALAFAAEPDVRAEGVSEEAFDLAFALRGSWGAQLGEDGYAVARARRTARGAL
jgi:hypothetical protein